MAQPGVVAGVELGGTKSIALLADGAKSIDRFDIPTTSPERRWIDGTGSPLSRAFARGSS